MANDPQPRKTSKLKQPGFFTRMRASLNKGDSWLTYDLRNLLPGETVDQDALDELETQLLLADVGVEATGQVSGLLPIRITSGDAIIQGGSVGAEGGGVLKIDNPSVNQALASDEETVQMMTDVLKDFHYDSLNAEVDLPPGQDGKILLSLGGRNPAVLNGHPFRLNIALESDFRKLFSILRDVLDLSSTILGRRGNG